MNTQTKKVILVVEDDEVINLAYKKALEAEGFETIFATSGEQCCNLVQQQKPDLILLDIMLGGQQNGFDVLSTLKEDNDTKDIPVFVMTNLDNTHKKEALEMGANKFFIKADTSLTETIKNIKEFI